MSEVFDGETHPFVAAAGRADDTVGEAERQLRRLDTALEVGIAIVDETGRPRFIGDHARQLLGILDSDEPDDEAERVFGAVRPSIAAAVNDGESRERVLTMTDCGGATRDLEVRIAPLSSNGSSEAIVQLRDGARVELLEQSLLEAARLRALTRLSLGIAHDLRAPMNAIALNLVNLKDGLVDSGWSGADEHGEVIEMLEDELRRLQRSVETLLMQTTPVRMEAEVFSVGDVIDEITGLMQAQARQNYLTLKVVATAGQISVRAHRDWIKQAIINLVVNALDATPKGGTVAIEAAGDDDWAVITVSDTGPGIPRHIAERLFERAATTKPRGVGIGLAMARAAVEAAGGRLELIRSDESGACFEIRLPLKHGEEYRGAS
ncbi:MAG: HAMP domain-containing sensor histidine kinase [Thermoanaerobaculales bacterium]|nr:HAMP domain-containing sensor histidine kinase [Thermoanaerobaculales bacterium]